MTRSRDPSKPRPYDAMGRSIVEIRQSLLWSQGELARRTGFSPGYVGNVESGRRRPEPRNLHIFATALGVPYSQLAVLAGYQLPGGGQMDTAVALERIAEAERQLQSLLSTLRSLFLGLQQDS